MKISYNWIKEYLDFDLTPSELSLILTGIGLEIEGYGEWESVKGGLQGIVIGEVLTCKKHPDADKLSVTTVNTGTGEPLHIVCGAPNVAAGQKVPVATVGSVVYKGAESLEIKKSKIRGELSEGMICAEDELGLGSSHEGIMILAPDAVPGTKAADYFGITKDFVFEIGLTPNRIDSGSHFGVARDLAAWLAVNRNFEGRAKLPSVDAFRPGNNSLEMEVIVENTADCPRYSGLTISGIRVGESPEWLKNRLRAVGLNPINNVVDVTNFVQHEAGQPLHAFDAGMIKGNKVIIRNLPDLTKFLTLDEVERTLSAKDLMICNSEEGMCIAGIFGGHKSGVTSSTTSIFLESAYFNPVAIRKSSKRHGLKTDASFRFERGADPNITTWALKRAALLIIETAGGEISSGIKDVYPERIKNAVVELSYANTARLIGKTIDPGVIRRILGLLDIVILSEEGDKLVLEIPAYRVDVKCEADVIEEILRIYGYNNIETGMHVNSTLSFFEKPDREKLVNIVADMLAANGFSEIMCNSLNPAAWYERNNDFGTDELVRLANPLSSDLNSMRLSLLYGGLTSVAWNINRQNHDLKLFEFGNVYSHKRKGDASVIVADPVPGTNQTPVSSVSDYRERTVLDIFISGNISRQSWNSKSQPGDFFSMKSWVEAVLSRLGMKPEALASGESNRGWFAESVTWSQNGKLVAEAGRISKKYLRQCDIEQDVYYGHIEWDLLIKLTRNHRIEFTELPRYPSVRRDLALLVDKDVKFARIREIALKTEKNILKDINLFDVYESDSLGAGKKSYAVSFMLRDDLRTLTDKNIEKTMNNLLKAFERELNAQIR